MESKKKIIVAAIAAVLFFVFIGVGFGGTMLVKSFVGEDEFTSFVDGLKSYIPFMGSDEEIVIEPVEPVEPVKPFIDDKKDTDSLDVTGDTTIVEEKTIVEPEPVPAVEALKSTKIAYDTITSNGVRYARTIEVKVYENVNTGKKRTERNELSRTRIDDDPYIIEPGPPGPPLPPLPEPENVMGKGEFESLLNGCSDDLINGTDKVSSRIHFTVRNQRADENPVSTANDVINKLGARQWQRVRVISVGRDKKGRIISAVIEPVY